MAISNPLDIFGNSVQTGAATDANRYLDTGLQGYLGSLQQGQQQLQTNYAKGLAPSQQNYSQAQPGVKQLQDLLGLSGPIGTSAAYQALQSTPGYNFNLNQGLGAIAAQNAATGQTGSGNAAKAAQQFGAGLASNTFQNAVQNAVPWLNSAQQSAGNILQGYSGLANAQNANLTNQGAGIYGANAQKGVNASNADLASLTGAANMWGLGTGLLGLGANTVGGGLLNKGIGSLASLLPQSDIRVKDNVEKVGKLDDGQSIYRFTYKNDPAHIVHIGGMAQEIEKQYPDAVIEVDGIKHVDYGRATNRAAQLQASMR